MKKFILIFVFIFISFIIIGCSSDEVEITAKKEVKQIDKKYNTKWQEGEKNPLMYNMLQEHTEYTLTTIQETDFSFLMLKEFKKDLKQNKVKLGIIDLQNGTGFIIFKNIHYACDINIMNKFTTLTVQNFGTIDINNENKKVDYSNFKL